MARTPLVQLLRRAAALAARARLSGAPLDELVGHEQARRVDTARRRFLQQSASASAALALSACVRSPARTATSADEVVIVGAGIAGLTCAWRLRQAGVRVRVFEAQERIGGRMLSLSGHFADGQVCELGGELIDSGHVRIRALSAEFGLALDDLEQDPTFAFGDVWFGDGRRYTEAQVLEAFAPIADAIARDASTLPEDADTITYAAPAGAQSLDLETMTGWLDRNGASGWLRRLIEVAYTTEMGLDCGEQSALNFLTFIDPATTKFRIFGESDERFHVRGGNDRIAHAVAAKVADAVTTGAILESLRQSADGTFVLGFKRGAGAFETRAREVVLALPFSTLRQVRLQVALPPAKQRAIAQMRYGTNAKLMIGFDERVWRTRHASSASTYSDLPLQTTWETSRMQPGTGGILTNFVGGRHGVEMGAGSPKEQADAAVRQLDAIFPGIASARSGAREARFHWPTHPWTLGSYACYTPGQWTTIRGAAGESVGHLHFAGEHCALANQGFMEGGVETGEWAAQAVMTARGVRAAT